MKIEHPFSQPVPKGWVEIKIGAKIPEGSQWLYHDGLRLPVSSFGTRLNRSDLCGDYAIAIKPIKRK